MVLAIPLILLGFASWGLLIEPAVRRAQLERQVADVASELELLQLLGEPDASFDAAAGVPPAIAGDFGAGADIVVHQWVREDLGYRKVSATVDRESRAVLRVSIDRP